MTLHLHVIQSFESELALATSAAAYHVVFDMSPFVHGCGYGDGGSMFGRSETGVCMPTAQENQHNMSTKPRPF